MTRQESALRKAVLLLAGLVLLLAALLYGEWRKVKEADGNGEDGKTIAKVAGHPITRGEWESELRHRHGEEVLTDMVNRIAVETEAARLGVSVSERDVDREIEAAASGYDSEEQYYSQMESELGLSKEEVRDEAKYRLLLQAVATAGVSVSEQEIDDYLKQNPDQFKPVKKFELSVIKVSTYNEAEAALDRLEDGEDFAALAQEVSIDEDTRSQGGRVGTVEENDPFWPEDLLGAASGMDPGDIAGPFQLEDGSFAVIRTDKVIAPDRPGEAEIRDQVRTEIALEKAPPLEEIEDDLRTKYDVSIDIDKGLQD